MRPADTIVAAIEDQGFTVSIDASLPEAAPAHVNWNDHTVRMRPGITEAESIAYLAHELAHVLREHKENSDANERCASLQGLLLVSEMLVTAWGPRSS